MFKFVKENQPMILGWCLFAKILFFGLSFADCLGALVVLTILQVERVIHHKFPERPDLFNEVSLIQTQINELNQKSEQLERDVRAVTLDKVLRGKNG